MFTSAAYRLKQGMRAIESAWHDLEDRPARQTLTPALYTLFRRMGRMERLHSLYVLRAVLDQASVTPPALATAALLHDCGKTRYKVRLSGKALAVLIRQFAPALFRKWSAADPDRQRWTRPFALYAHHPAWSATLMREHGADADSIWLAAHHADDAAMWRAHPLYALLVRLQAADNTN